MIIITVIVILIILVISFVFYSTNSLKKISYNKTNESECEKGYIKTPVPFLTNEMKYYCKIDKEWEEFEKCMKPYYCPQNYSCISIINNETDFRCIPFSNYQLDSGCNPSENGTPKCWAM